MEISRMKKCKLLKIFLIVFSILLSLCIAFLVLYSNKTKTNILKIEVDFLHPITSSPITITKEDITENEYRFISEIKGNNSSLILIEKNLKNLEIDNDQSKYNIIIVCKIYYNNGIIDELLLGSYWGTTLNGMRMKDNFDLNYLIKNEIGFYDLVDYNFLNEVDDLKDTIKLNNVKNNYKKQNKFKKNKYIGID